MRTRPLTFQVLIVSGVSPSIQGSEIVELDPTHNAMRKKENPVLWVIPADQPFTGKKRGSMINSLLCTF